MLQTIKMVFLLSNNDLERYRQNGGKTLEGLLWEVKNKYDNRSHKKLKNNQKMRCCVKCEQLLPHSCWTPSPPTSRSWWMPGTAPILSTYHEENLLLFFVWSKFVFKWCCAATIRATPLPIGLALPPSPPPPHPSPGGEKNLLTK